MSATTHSIGKIKRVPLREVWKHEAHDLTMWLEENIDVLNDRLDFNLVSVERERSAGAFSADLVGEDEAGRIVVIENQLEKSNHDHLGKLITYVAYMDARVRESKTERGKRVIPILHELRPELLRWRDHQEAIGLGDPRTPVLATKLGKNMSPRHIWRVTKRVAVRAGIRPVPDRGRSEISPHTLRRTLGSHLLNRGARLEVVSKLLGHDSTQTTERAYAELLDATIAAEVMRL